MAMGRSRLQTATMPAMSCAGGHRMQTRRPSPDRAVAVWRRLLRHHAALTNAQAAVRFSLHRNYFWDFERFSALSANFPLTHFSKPLFMNDETDGAVVLKRCCSVRFGFSRPPPPSEVAVAWTNSIQAPIRSLPVPTNEAQLSLFST